MADDWPRWLAGLLVAALIVALLLIARGERQRGEPVGSPAGAGPAIERLAWAEAPLEGDPA